ncbi:MAG: adenylate/guanylate cyclase domain-containing protein [Coriobacteriia bacterium]
MPRKRTIRRFGGTLPWLRAVAFATIALGSLSAMPFYPSSITPVIALVIGGLGVLSAQLATLAVLTLLALPIAAANIVAGALFALVGYSAMSYLGQDDAKPFLVVALAMLAAGVKAQWALPVLAGYLLGSGEGSIAALAACLAAEGAGLLLGHPVFGVVVAGGTPPPIVDLAHPPVDPLAFKWFAASVSSLDPNPVIARITAARDVPLLATQPFAWAGAAWLAGFIRRPVGHRFRGVWGLGAVFAGVAALGGSSVALMRAFSGPVNGATLAATGVTSFVVALLVSAVSDWVFTPSTPKAIVPLSSLDTEDADVDELLRLISQAEETVAAKHTVEAVVLITDMKSFSKMTEEEGSITSAKLIQRQRDLLLPLVTEHRGCGKSTGGDGLLAKFDHPIDALEAAIAMQRKLSEFNTAKDIGHSMTIRIGIASGEVVLDKHGRPFIGNGLNIAARVMSLADGGQIFATRPVVERAGLDRFKAEERGTFDLKNIATPTDVFEIDSGV